jgi:sugar/nucleoside kinase (ribokinase family)
VTTRIVVLGDLMIDVVAVTRTPVAVGSDTPASVRMSGGGSAANTAAWLAAAGTTTSLIGRVGDDSTGRSAVTELDGIGVDVRVAVDPDHPTGMCVIVSTPDGQRSMFPDTGANGWIRDVDLPDDVFVPGAHLHVAGYALLSEGSRPAAVAALELARGRGMTTSVDPSSAGPLAAIGPARFLSWTENVDLLLPNEAEAVLLSGAADPFRAGSELAGRFGQVVVKLGRSGAAWFAGDRVVPAAPPPVEAVDTTGAGDCFAAGFLPAWLAGEGPASALAAGCRLAAQVVARHGARPEGATRPG